MKTPLVLAALFLFATGFARADYILVQKSEGAGQENQITIKIGADKVRTDLNAQVSSLMDINTGDVTTLMHTQKVYMVMNQAAAKAMAAQMSKMLAKNGATTGTASAPVATGKTDTINGFKAAEYTYDTGSVKGSVWMSSDIPNAKGIADAMARMRKGAINDATKAFAPDFSTLSGVPVRTEVNLGGMKMVTDLVSVKEAAVSPDQYAVPADYKKMDMPGMPGSPAQ